MAPDGPHPQAAGLDGAAEPAVAVGLRRSRRVPAALGPGQRGAATVVNARLATAGDYAALAGFCVLATSSFLALELYAVFAPAAAGILLERLRKWLDIHQDQVIIILFLLLGFWLAGKSLYLLVA